MPHSPCRGIGRLSRRWLSLMPAQYATSSVGSLWSPSAAGLAGPTHARRASSDIRSGRAVLTAPPRQNVDAPHRALAASPLQHPVTCPPARKPTPRHRMAADFHRRQQAARRCQQCLGSVVPHAVGEIGARSMQKRTHHDSQILGAEVPLAVYPKWGQSDLGAPGSTSDGACKLCDGSGSGKVGVTDEYPKQRHKAIGQCSALCALCARIHAWHTIPGTHTGSTRETSLRLINGDTSVLD